MKSSTPKKESMRALAIRAWHRLRGGELCPRRAALSVAIGILVGCSPAYGLHWLGVLAFCLPLRLDSTLAFAATMISNPLTLPLLLGVEAYIGAALLSEPVMDLDNLDAGTIVSQLGLGAAVLGVGLAVMGGIVTAVFVHMRRQPEPDDGLLEPLTTLGVSSIPARPEN